MISGGAIAAAAAPSKNSLRDNGGMISFIKIRIQEVRLVNVMWALTYIKT